MYRNLKVVVFFVLMFFSVSAFPQEMQYDFFADSLYCYKDEAVKEINADKSDLNEMRSYPFIWGRFIYPHEDYLGLIRYCNKQQSQSQIRNVLDMLFQVEHLLSETERPKGMLYVILSMMNDRVGNKINSNNYLKLAVKEFDKGLSEEKQKNEQLQYRIYELQSILLNKQKRSNIVFFLFIALAGAYFVLTRDSKMRHLDRKKKQVQHDENPDSMDEDLIEKVNLAVNIILQSKRPDLTGDEIRGLGFESKDDFLVSFQTVIGMSPKEYYNKNILNH